MIAEEKIRDLMLEHLGDATGFVRAVEQITNREAAGRCVNLMRMLPNQTDHGQIISRADAILAIRAAFLL